LYLATYQASKAALIAASEGWRLELAPLGVRVITLVTGGVATNFLANLEPVTLPEDSYYMCVQDMINEHPEKVPLGMDPEVFALAVLSRVEKGASGKFWVGGGSIIARFAVWVSPTWLIVSNPISLIRHQVAGMLIEVCRI
jgi:1-acylglycerone phosphate reductase